MKPYCHARNSVRKHGGKLEDYLHIHNFLNESKAHFGDVRHRALLHSTFGIFLAERIYDVFFKNSDDVTVTVTRDGIDVADYSDHD